MLNIGGDQNDRSYRYKMPKLIAKVEGRGNGIKTRVPNCHEIALSLHRPAPVVTKFFGCQLGAQSKWDEKELSCIVNGEHTQAALQAQLVDEFLPKFVLCSNCHLPETDMKVRKEMIRFQCAACGAESFADMTHKLCTFILAQSSKSKKEGKEDKKPRKEKKPEKEKSEKGEKKEKKTKKDKKSKKEESEEEIEWYTDVSAEAVEARRLESMTGQLADLVAELPDEPEKNCTQEGAKAEEGSGSAGSKSDSCENSKSNSDCDETTPPLAVVEPEETLKTSVDPAVQAVLDDLLPLFEGLIKQKDINKGVENAAPKLLSAKLSAAHNFELLMNLPDNVAKYSALVLKSMYDQDIVDEPAIVSWFEAADQSNLAVSKAGAFVEWLTSAESDE